MLISSEKIRILNSRIKVFDSSTIEVLSKAEVIPFSFTDYAKKSYKYLHRPDPSYCSDIDSRQSKLENIKFLIMNFNELQKLFSEKLDIVHLSDIARELSVSPQVINNWKKRDKIPYKYVKKIRNIEKVIEKEKV